MNGFLKNIFRKKDLRERCKKKYGNDFVNMYDTINSGGTIGGIEETIIFLRLIEEVKGANNGKRNNIS